MSIASLMNRAQRRLTSFRRRPLEKGAAEIAFWREEINRYESWYEGKVDKLYRTPSPRPSERIHCRDRRVASVLTWHRLHQEPKYLADLSLSAEAFSGKRLLDVGSGPIPSATCFTGADLYCLDPLFPRYLDAGFPLHCYGNVKFIQAHAEDIPVDDGFFDAIISVNAIDHVDDIRRTSLELRRVLRPGGSVRIHAHYHPPTTCEPIQLDCATFADAFAWCAGLTEIHTADRSYSKDLPPGETFALWSNF